MTSEFDKLMAVAVEAASVVGDGDLKSLVATGQKTVGMKLQIDELDAELGKLKAEYTDLRQRVLPDAMARVGLARFVLDDGTEIKVEEFVGGGIPKDPEAKQRALDWLIEHEASSLIKTSVNLTFGRNQYDEAVALADDLKAKGLPVDIGTGVHPQTLHAFIRERLRRGESVDQTVLGVFVGRVAKFKGA